MKDGHISWKERSKISPDSWSSQKNYGSQGIFAMITYFPLVPHGPLNSKKSPYAPPGMGSALGYGEFLEVSVGLSSARRPT